MNKYQCYTKLINLLLHLVLFYGSVRSQNTTKPFFLFVYKKHAPVAESAIILDIVFSKCHLDDRFVHIGEKQIKPRE